MNDVPARPAMRTIRREALVLEPQVAAHADEMFAVLGDPAIYEFENEPPRSVEWLRDRYARLESRCSLDGTEQWFNWVLRGADGRAAGYLQATVYGGSRADIAYELASAHWGRGLAAQATQAMIDELATHHGVQRLSAMLKRANHRSLRLLQRLGFAVSSSAEHRRRDIADDEILLERACDANALCVREFLPDDRADALALWHAAPCVGLSAADEPAALARFLARNPGLSQVATRGTTLIGTVLCGHDGRRGLIYHLVVAEAERRRGLARRLLDRSLAALQRTGVGKCHLMVFGDNAAGQAFWRRVGAQPRSELALYSMNLRRAD